MSDGVDMNQVKRATMVGMIEMELQQGWQCLGVGQFDLAKKHFLEAAAKVEELERIAGEEPAAVIVQTAEPIVLPEHEHDTHELKQLILEV